MANEIMRARLQSPQDDQGNRKDIMLVTDVTSVVVDGTNPETSKTLDTLLEEIEEKVDTSVEKVNNATDIYTSKLVPSDSKSHLWVEVLTNYSKADYKWVITASSAVSGSLLIVPNTIADDKFDPTTMIKVNELLAYDNTLAPVAGNYAYKTTK